MGKGSSRREEDHEKVSANWPMVDPFEKRMDAKRVQEGKMTQEQYDQKYGEQE